MTKEIKRYFFWIFLDFDETFRNFFFCFLIFLDFENHKSWRIFFPHLSCLSYLSQDYKYFLLRIFFGFQTSHFFNDSQRKEGEVEVNTNKVFIRFRFTFSLQIQLKSKWHYAMFTNWQQDINRTWSSSIVSKVSVTLVKQKGEEEEEFIQSWVTRGTQLVNKKTKQKAKQKCRKLHISVRYRYHNAH